MKYLAIAAFLVAIAHPASSTTLRTTAIGYTGPALTIPAFYGDPNNFLFFSGTLPIGNGNTITTTAPAESDIGVIGGPDGYSLNANGHIYNSPYVGLDDNSSTITLKFAVPTQSFGLGVNYAVTTGGTISGSDPTIAAYDINNVLIASYDLETLAPIRTPGGADQFQFRGIDSTDAKIASFTLSGAFIVGQAQLASAVPEPATWALLLLGLGATALLIRRGQTGQRFLG